MNLCSGKLTGRLHLGICRIVLKARQGVYKGLVEGKVLEKIYWGT